jgi:hypothetical protein
LPTQISQPSPHVLKQDTQMHMPLLRYAESLRHCPAPCIYIKEARAFTDMPAGYVFAIPAREGTIADRNVIIIAAYDRKSLAVPVFRAGDSVTDID